MPAQTIQVFGGVIAALAYATAVGGVGIVVLFACCGERGCASVRAAVGLWGLGWLGFVVGQGIMGMVWLGLSLVGALRPSIVAMIVGLGLASWPVAVRRLRRLTVADERSPQGEGAVPAPRRSWYWYVAVGVGVVCALRGTIALLPPSVADALKVYLVMPRAVAASGSLQFQAFAHPFYGLLPLQVELPWAALFAISNETAVAVWDYLCALGFLGGTAVLALGLTSSRRVALVATLLVLSTPGFYLLMGGAKVDNAAAQYGIGAFLCVLLLPKLGRRAAFLAGLLMGWALASRYTDVILIPALIVVAVVALRHSSIVSPGIGSTRQRVWVSTALAAALGAIVAGGPMVLKNLVMTGCPLAPEFGCGGAFWASMNGLVEPNLSAADMLLYPFVWTFARRPNMLGNLSPLFVGLVPLLFLYRGVTALRPTLIAGLSGAVALVTWLLLQPLILHTRWLLVPLALIAVPLAASAVQLDEQSGKDRLVGWSLRLAMLGMLLVVLFDSRGAVYGARYAASRDSREAAYRGWSGEDVALWLNGQVTPRERVALAGYRGYPYFLRPEILLGSESGDELQWLWERGGRRSQSSPTGQAWNTMGFKAVALASSWSPDVWRFYVDHGFAYVVVTGDQLDAARASWPSPLGLRLDVAFEGREDSVLRLWQARQP